MKKKVKSQSSKRIIIALSLCFLVIVAGTVGYMFLEGYSFVDGVYMSIITISTVGFEEVNPLSETGRVFTSVLILSGILCIAFTGHAIGESLLEQVWNNRAEEKRMKKQISLLKDHYIVCGFGKVGQAAAKHLEESDAEIVIIEKGLDHCQKIREMGFLFLEGDATDEELLLAAGIKSARGLLALLDSDPDNLFLTLMGRELNPTLHIIGRAGTIASQKKIQRAGADSVVSPYITAGKQVADDVLVATGKSSLVSVGEKHDDSTPRWINIKSRPELVRKTISEASTAIEKKIIGLRRKNRDIISPDLNIKLKFRDMILIIGQLKDKAGKVDQVSFELPKVVLIDDNPAMLRLYSRLFRKVGFNPVTASNGKDGLDKIIKVKPKAAVIDFILSGISGIEVCRAVRENRECEDIKLILFADDVKNDTREKALEAGADTIIVKSAETLKVIETTIKLIRKKSSNKSQKEEMAAASHKEEFEVVL